jgi:general secretion pathway protein L
MEVINIQNWLVRLKSIFWRLNWQFDPFKELAAKPHKEFFVSPQGYRLFANSKADSVLPKLSVSNASPDLSGLNVNESLIVSIDHSLCFLHGFEVPTAALPKMQSILDYELARSTPFEPNQVIIGWNRLAGDSNANKIQVVMTIIRKDYIQPALDTLKQAGAKVEAIIVRDENSLAMPFAVTAEGGAYGASALRKWAALLGASVFSMMASLFLAYATISEFQTVSLATIDAQTAAYKKDASFVSKTLGVIKSNNTEIGDLLSRQSAISNRTKIIEELSRLLPDDTYLEMLSVYNSEIKIDGVSPSPELLIAILEESPILQNVTFAAPSYRNPGETKSRFSIKLEIERKQ